MTVIPTKVGIHFQASTAEEVDPDFRRDDDLCGYAAAAIALGGQPNSRAKAWVKALCSP